MTDGGDGTAAGVDRLLDRAFELAQSGLEGINEVAIELAELTGGDRGLIEGALRRARALAESEPSRLTKQVSALLRRALELGDWDWSDATTMDVSDVG
ncbi:MAG: hypothetical protein ABR511_04635 [Acidimicrobiales bacterium]